MESPENLLRLGIPSLKVLCKTSKNLTLTFTLTRTSLYLEIHELRQISRAG